MATETTNKKPNILVRMGKGIVRFFRDTKSETKKVVWPARKQVVNNCLVVASFVVLCALLIIGLDALFTWLFNLVLQLGA
jgi:preprotein translocase subunit SecE